MKTASLIGLIAALLISASAFGQAKGEHPQRVYRWVDENGEVHYSESLPPGMKDTTHDVLDEQGVERATGQTLVPKPPPPPPKSPKGELPRDASGMPRTEPLYSELEKQRKQDDMLLLRYDSEQEILDAMDVEIHQLAYDRNLLTTSGASLEQAYRGNVREAAERQRAGRPVEEALVKELRNLKHRMQQNAESLAALEKRETEIRATFGESLDRYRRLSAEYDEDKG